ncbi:hypothetical protein [Microlunatus parietis]|uniref:Chromate transport protein ChrA n=1 Tax=Microlunatus parietis TaxID=682979 RepID=A0A7Y9I850_9ACTN|nr:hypothetical protein [Microlunatus parietis]NYE72069.1 chromate transport protein ChrA [Microlunatus parietis]
MTTRLDDGPNKEKALMETVKKIAAWTGIVLTGLSGIVLLGGGKVTSGALLIATSFILVRPIRRLALPGWARAGLICAVFAVVIWNISTTELPNPSNDRAVSCARESAFAVTPTGFTFLDQVIYIVSTFVAQAAPS